MATVPYPVASASSVATSSTLVLTVGTLQVGSGATGTNAGDTIHVSTSLNSVAQLITGVTDSKGNTYVLENHNTGTEYDTYEYVCLSSASALVAGTDTITITRSSTVNNGWTADAIGINGVASVDVAPTPTLSAGSTSPSLSTGTLGQASEVIVGSVYSGSVSGAVAWTAPMTAVIPGYECPSSNQWAGTSATVVSATTAVTVAGTITSAKWVCSALTFKLSLPSITTTTLPAGVVGTAYSQTVAETGGVGPFSWAILSGSPPAGTVIGGSTGTIAGMPTTAGTFSFTVEVTDSNGNSSTQALSVVITGTTVRNILRPPSGYAWLSAYPGSGNADPNTGANPYEGATMANRRLAAWYRYYEVTQAVPTADDAALVTAGRFLVMSLAPSYAIPPASGGITYAAIAAGTYDSYLGAIGTAISKLAQPCFVVWGHEMELSSNAGFGTAAQFIASFQHVANVLRAAAPNNVIMCWVCSNASLTNTACAPYYPGDAYVDWLGVDPYDQNLTKGGGGEPANGPMATYQPYVQFLNSNPLAPGGGSGGGGAIGKPYGVFETGVAQPPTNTDANIATWYSNVPAALQSLGYQFFQPFNSSGTLGNCAIVPGSLTASALATIGASSFFNPPAVLPSNNPYPIGQAAPAIVSGNTAVITVTQATNVGDVIVVSASIDSSGAALPSTCADSQGNTYTRAPNTSVTMYGSAQFTAKCTTALSPLTPDTITVTYSVTNTDGKVATAVGVPGAAASGYVDTAVSAASTTASTAISLTTGTQAQAQEVIVAFATNGAAGGPVEWGTGMVQQIAGFEAPSSNQWGSVATQVTNSTGGVTVTGTIASAKWTALALGIKLTSTPTVTTTSLPGGVTGVPYSQTLTANGGFTPYVWSISAGSLPAGLLLNASTGVISGTVATPGTTSFTVKVTDNASNTATQALSITITGNLAVSTTSLPGATTGTAYSTILTGSGGTAPYTWAITAGSLPTGVTLNTGTGVISGTPTTAGTASFTVQVTDVASNTATQPLSIVVTSNLSVTTTTVPAGTVGNPYSATLVGTGGSGAYSWSLTAGSLPSPLILSSGGVISGTPAGAGVSTFTVEITDAGGNTATRNLAITVGTGILPTSVINTWQAPVKPASYTYGTVQVPVASSKGNWLFAVVQWDATANPAVVYAADDAHNFWRPLKCNNSGTSSTGVAILCVQNARAAKLVSFSSTAFIRNATYTVLEVQGLNAAFVLDAVAVASTAGATSLSATINGLTANDFVLASVVQNTTANAISTSSGWATISVPQNTNIQSSIAWMTTTGASSETITWTNTGSTSSPWGGVVIAVQQYAPLPVNANPTWPVIQCQAAFGFVPGSPASWPVWTDITSRFLGINGKRGRQFELDELEAADLTIDLDNFDGALNPLNTGSPYYPNVSLILPIRLLATWQGQTQPVFSGHVEYLPQTWPDMRGVVEAQASDSFAKLAQVFLQGCMENEILYDQPQFYWALGDASGAPTGANDSGITADVMTPTNNRFGGVANSFGNTSVAVYGATPPTASNYTSWFAGDSGTVWNVSGVTALGTSLSVTPSSFPSFAGSSITIETWAQLDASQSGISTFQPVFVLEGNTPASQGQIVQLGANFTGGNPQLIWYNGSGVPQVNTYTGASLTDQHWHHHVLICNPASYTYYLDDVVVLSGSWSGIISTSPTQFELAGTTSRFVSGSGQFTNGNFSHTAIYNAALDPERITTHYQSGVSGFNGEDNGSRISRLLRYSGWIQPQAVDPGQTGSQQLNYLNTGGYGSQAVNGAQGLYGAFGTIGGQGTQADTAVEDVAASDNGLVYVDATGTFVFKSRQNVYNGALRGVFGDAWVPLNQNVDFNGTIVPWTGQGSSNPLTLDGATWKYEGSNSCLITPDGSTANPGAVSEHIPVTAGTEYTVNTWAFCQLGWANVQILISWYNSSAGLISTVTSPSIYLAPSTPDQLAFANQLAPAGAVTAVFVVQMTGTPGATNAMWIDRTSLSLTGTQVPYLDDIEIDYDITYLFNDVTFTRNVDQVSVRVVDATSKNDYYPRVYSRTVYTQSQTPPVELTDGANWLLSSYKQPAYRIAKMTVDALGSPDAWQLVLALDIGDMVSVLRTPFGAPPILENYLIVSVSPNFDQDSASFDYVLTPVLSPVLTLGDPVYGLFGANSLGW